jgi:hypothetical protein
VHRVLLDQKATKEIRVIKDFQEQMAYKAQKATPVNKAYKDLLVMMEP